MLSLLKFRNNMDRCMGSTTKFQLNNRYNTLLMRLILLLLIGISLDSSVNASPLNQISNTFMAPIDEPNPYSQKYHFKKHMPSSSDHNFDGDYLSTNFIDGQEDLDNDFGQMNEFYDSKDTKSFSSKRPQHPYKMVKKALSLFAHWKPSLYTSSEDNSMRSDVVSAVARGHLRPIGGPLRWGRR